MVVQSVVEVEREAFQTIQKILLKTWRLSLQHLISDLYANSLERHLS